MVLPVLSVLFSVHPLAVIPKLSAQWRKTRAPDANGVGTALSYGTVADARDRIEEALRLNGGSRDVVLISQPSVDLE